MIDIDGDQKSWLIFAAMAIIGACFIATQIRGCVQDNNAKVKQLAEQGIRAEVDPNGAIRVLDTRDFHSRAEKGAQ